MAGGLGRGKGREAGACLGVRGGAKASGARLGEGQTKGQKEELGTRRAKVLRSVVRPWVVTCGCDHVSPTIKKMSGLGPTKVTAVSPVPGTVAGTEQASDYTAAE